MSKTVFASRLSTVALVVLVPITAVASELELFANGLGVQIVYSNPERTFFEGFVLDLGEDQPGVWVGGNLFPKKPTHEQKYDLGFADITDTPLHDCSDADYLCVYGLYRVFAVPRKGLRADADYVAGGAVFHVAECLRGNAKRCQVAVIRSGCGVLKRPDQCSVSADIRQGKVAPAKYMYFLYNEDFGVTAYESGVRKKPIDFEIEKPVFNRILQSQSGLLIR